MKVDKNQFDALLNTMMQAPPDPKGAIKTEGTAGKLVPHIQPPVEARFKL